MKTLLIVSSIVSTVVIILLVKKNNDLQKALDNALKFVVKIPKTENNSTN